MTHEFAACSRRSPSTCPSCQSCPTLDYIYTAQRRRPLAALLPEPVLTQYRSPAAMIRHLHACILTLSSWLPSVLTAFIPTPTLRCARPRQRAAQDRLGVSRLILIIPTIPSRLRVPCLPSSPRSHRPLRRTVPGCSTLDFLGRGDVEECARPGLMHLIQRCLQLRAKHHFAGRPAL
ncbi:hypothetical protein FB45DRAFT_272806 [Roridomyces roridus]|uniref:Uncharacterized protein n=1 Tax=Roridomyces roridus TaxID=1738132 RepID=A0AAD7B861_9AGAR|nr:hypothetical protein FB45DRAFT_272806 [Roridomyces roridus]